MGDVRFLRAGPPKSEVAMIQRAGHWGFRRDDLQKSTLPAIMRFQRGGRRLEMYRASDSVRMTFVDPNDRPGAVGGNAFDEMRALTHGMNETLLGLSATVQPVHFAAPATRQTVGVPPDEVVIVRRRIVETRFKFGEFPGWGARLTVDFDDVERIQRVTLIWRDQRVSPASASAPLLDRQAAQHAYVKDFSGEYGITSDADVSVDGPGYLFAAPDEVQAWILPAYRARFPLQPGVPIKYYPACSLDDMSAQFSASWY